jgi:hypothetical protein
MKQKNQRPGPKGAIEPVKKKKNAVINVGRESRKNLKVYTNNLTLQNVQNIFGSKSYAEWEILHA